MGVRSESPEGEWWEDDLGVVVGVQGTVWFGYPERGPGRIGPFASLLEARRALEHERSCSVEPCELAADEDVPTQKRPRPGGLGG